MNRELVHPPRKISAGFDLHLLGDCDDVVQHLCQRLGWELPPASPPAKATSPPAPTSATAPLPQAVGPPAADAKAEAEDSPHPPPLPPPKFLPPNSYLFCSSRDIVGGDAAAMGGSTAWAMLSGGDGKGGGEDGNDNDFHEVVTW